jgi:hypothetical protein
MGINTDRGTLFAFQTDRRIDGNPVNPGEKQRVALEAGQGLVGIQKRFLHNVLRVFGITDHPKHSVEQAVLIAAHQLPKGRASALQTFSNEAAVVGTHSFVSSIGRGEQMNGSRKKRDQFSRNPCQYVNDAKRKGQSQSEGDSFAACGLALGLLGRMRQTRLFQTVPP